MTSPHSEDPGESAPTITLGSVLYADNQAPVLEDEWMELVHNIANRDQSALRVLYDGTNRIVFTLIYRIAKDPLVAEEVLLDVYHDVWRKASSFDASRGTVIAWLMNQARSRAIDRLRSDQRKKRQSSNGSAQVDVETALDPSLAVQRRSVLERSLQSLTVDERRAIETAYFQELTYAEAADRLGEPLGTIKTRIRTGLAKLRTLLVGKVDL